MSNTDENLNELRAALRADAAAVAEALLGPANKATSTKRTHRWGGKGSLAVEVTGANRGLWFTHEGGEGSDLLGLIRHVHRCDFQNALAWARNWTGVDPDADRPFTARDWAPPPQPDLQEVAEEAAARTDKIAHAQRIAATSVPTVGTVGEYYLKQQRGIPVPASGWPDAIRWHPVYRAVVAVATLPDGTVQAVQRIHLDANGSKIGPDEQAVRRLPAVKVTNGPQDGAAVRLPGNPTGPLLLAEGPETGLAAYTATGHETWIALGALGKLEPPTGRLVVAVADDNPPAHDARYGQAAKALRKAVTVWGKAGVKVVLAYPWETRRRDKSDLADVILYRGREAVRDRLAHVLGLASGATRKRVSAERAREMVGDAVRKFFGRVDEMSVARAEWGAQAKAAVSSVSVGPVDSEPPSPSPEPSPMTAADWGAVFDTPPEPDVARTFTHGVRVSVGIGKSHAARAEIARTLVAMRQRGDARALVLAVPMHVLGNEQSASFMALPEVQKAGFRVAIWRGRGALDPDHPDYLHVDPSRARAATMCQDLERVSDAQSVNLSVQSAVCSRRIKMPDGSNGTAKCPLFDRCAYQAQSRREADLWVVSHNSLFHEKPKNIGDVAAVVVDEAAWKRGLIGAEGRHITLSLDSLQADVAHVPGVTSAIDGARLQDLRRQLYEAVCDMPDGPIRADALKNTLLTHESTIEANRLEWSRQVDPFHPGQTREERHAARDTAQGNKLIPRMAMAWKALGRLLSPGAPEASGWIEVATDDTSNGPVRVLRLKGRSDVRDGWKVPTLLLDALLPVDLVREFWPDIEMVADIEASAPHQHVRQVVDSAYSKAMLEQIAGDDGQAPTAEAKRRANRLHDLRAILVRTARQYAPGQVLVVLQQSVERSLLDLGRLPPNLMTAHHNNIAGVDRWRDVACIVVVGRTMPPPGGAERIAEALTGRACQRVGRGAWYDRTDAAREMEDGTTLPAEMDRHPDPLAEVVRWQVAEGELVQIIGRGRGCNRAAETPLDILVLTDAVLPIPLAGTVDAAELEPSCADKMVAAGGVAFETPADASAAYPFLWANKEAAKKAFQREKWGTFPYKDSYIGECPPLRQIGYKVAGQGRRDAVAWFDPVLCPDPEAFLVDALGVLAWCRVSEAMPPEPGPPRPPVPSPRPPTPPRSDIGIGGVPDVDRQRPGGGTLQQNAGSMPALEPPGAGFALADLFNPAKLHNRRPIAPERQWKSNA